MTRRRPRKHDFHLPRCPYCGCAAQLGPHPSGPQFKPVWSCPLAACDARVGTMDDGRTPLGSLANGALRVARMRAHASFDVLWKGKPKPSRCATFGVRREAPAMKRWEAYAWLSEAMGLAAELCHIGRFDFDQCVRVVALIAGRPA